MITNLHAAQPNVLSTLGPEARPVPSGPPVRAQASGRLDAEPPTRAPSEVDLPREIRLPEFSRYALSMRLDEELNRVVIEIIDPETKSVLRSIPPEEIIGVLKRLQDARGVLLDTEG